MQHRVFNGERKKVILKNIRLLRKLKGIKSETMAKEIGISLSEYSKLENGFKNNWEKYWDSIAAVLQITPFELVFEDCIALNQSNKPDIKTEQDKFNLNHTINDKVFKALEDKDKLKDELLQTYKLNADYWKGKYERAKIRLEKADRKIIELTSNHLNAIDISVDSVQSLANVRGGLRLNKNLLQKLLYFSNSKRAVAFCFME
jgi:transcriptional regulator with XRE-family HTH domain